MAEPKAISLAAAMKQIVAQIDGPTPLDDVIRRVLAIWPSRAKNPAASVRNHLRWDEVGTTLVFLDPQTIVPLRVVMQGVRFRINITPQIAQQGTLPIRPFFDFFLRRGINEQDIQLMDEAGKPLAVRTITVEQPHESPMLAALLGSSTYQTLALELKDWFRAQRLKSGGSVIITVDDWEIGRFRIAAEPAPRRDEIKRKNTELADLLFAMLEESRDEMLLAHMAVPTAYIRLSDPRGYPGDHWVEVLERDGRMQYDGYAIRYREYRSFFDMMLEGDEPAVAETPFSKEQARQVYRFKASLWHRPGLWRTVEVQGGQTLAELDRILRQAFQHDTMDHLGGFWKLVPRGKGKRVREVDLGDVDPFGEGSATEVHLAGLGLKPGDQLKYVYDFGDWIEHRLVLEAITEPAARTRYPRITDRNKPKHSYCEACKQQGRTTVATWICLDCTNEHGREVLICEQCMQEQHEEHYVEEILY